MKGPSIIILLRKILREQIFNILEAEALEAGAILKRVAPYHQLETEALEVGSILKWSGPFEYHFASQNPQGPNFQ